MHHQHRLLSDVCAECFNTPGRPRIISIICSSVFAANSPASLASVAQGCSAKFYKDPASHASSASFAPSVSFEGFQDQASHASSASFAPGFSWMSEQPRIVSIAGKFPTTKPRITSVIRSRGFLPSFQRPSRPRITSIICSRWFPCSKPATCHQHHLLPGFCNTSKIQASHASSSSPLAPRSVWKVSTDQDSHARTAF